MKNLTIEEMVAQAIELCRKQGYAESTVDSKRKVFNSVIRFHEANNRSVYDEELTMEYVRKQTSKFKKGKLKRDSYSYKVKTILQLQRLFDTGTIDYGCMGRVTGMTPYYSDIIDQMLSFPDWDKTYSHNIRRYAMTFFKWLDSERIESLDKVDETIIRRYLMDSAKRLKINSVHHMNYGLKRLFYFLHAVGITESDFYHVFSFQLPKENKVRKPISHAETADILEVIDRSTPMGKRNYAMILIGAVTGLRSIDIRELEFKNIDWVNGEIRISQSKTGKALALPLTKDVGEAIKDYILHGRPDIDSGYIFLKTFAPYTKLTASCLYNAFNKYRFQLGRKRCGFHDLRRSLGTSLVVAGTSVTTVAQVLGHRNLESTKQYISLDTEHLRDVGLDLDDLMPKEGFSNEDF